MADMFRIAPCYVSRLTNRVGVRRNIMDYCQLPADMAALYKTLCRTKRIPAAEARTMIDEIMAKRGGANV